MHTLRTFRMSAAVAAAAVTLGSLGTGAASAASGKPSRPGTPTVTAGATEPSIGTYVVASSWSAVTGATSYRAVVSRAGTTLTSATLGGTSWTVDVAATPGQQLLVSVQAVVSKRAGKPGTTTVPLTDQIAPTGTYHSTFATDAGTATITQDSLVDDSPTTGVTRTVDWGDGTVVAWASGTTIDHTYPLVAARYIPTVTLRDAAGHVTVVDSSGVVVADDTPPTGTFTLDRSAAWAAYTSVTVTQTSLSDLWSPTAAITRSVDWGDGTVTDWTSGTTLSHVYASAGSFTPAVTITDEAGNAAVVPTSAVSVTADTTGPKVTVTVPSARHSVRAWRTLRGTATDAGTGVRTVSLKAVEKRAGHWYGYNAVTRAWVRATSRTKAFAKARAFRRRPDSLGRWSASLAGLAKGTLVLRVWAVDQVGNRSATLTRQASL